MNSQKEITVLGGGPAGLAAGYYARKHDLNFRLFEASGRVGGNCVTLNHKGFLFDSGAHRFHDRIPEVTAEVSAMLRNELVKARAPSKIYYQGNLINFPLQPFDLLKNIGVLSFTGSGIEVMLTKFKRNSEEENFECFAINKYGKTLAGKFLLNYSEKLWGLSCKHLSPYISGSRMKGLDLASFLREWVFGARRNTQHLDGEFYYPKKGIGQITEALAHGCGLKNISLHARITRILHNSNQIEAVEINGEKRHKVDEVISTLPLSVLVSMLRPKPPPHLLEAARQLRFRNMILMLVAVKQPQVTPFASIYFPEQQFPFTRIYEPKNRSLHMSPSGKTSLVVEIPCFLNDDVWQMDENSLREILLPEAVSTGLLKHTDILETKFFKMPNAYPVLDISSIESTRILQEFLSQFHNLHLLGRNGTFRYLHIHDLMNKGRKVIHKMVTTSDENHPAIPTNRSTFAASFHKSFL